VVGDAQEGLHRLVCPLRESIRRRVIRGSLVRINVEVGAQEVPEMTGHPGVAVSDDASRWTVVLDYVVQELLRGVLRALLFASWNEVDHPGSPIGDGEDGIQASSTSRHCR
jgi:hypothetical protein